jgi:hypothetical protein
VALRRGDSRATPETPAPVGNRGTGAQRLATYEYALVVATGLLTFLIFLLVRTSLIDDAYITLAYAQNLALDLHWGLIPQETANTATSPLNVALLGGITALTRLSGDAHPVIALGALSVAAAMVMAGGWIRVLRALQLPLAVGAIGVLLVLGNPFLVSSIGLEVLLIPALLIVLLAMALEERPGWFGVVAGLTVLCRLDLIVIVLVMAAATPAVRRSWLRAAGAAILVAAPWFVFSWIALGSAVPDTLVIKTSQQELFSIWTYLIGPVLYGTRHWNVVALAFVPALLGLFMLVAWFLARASIRWEAERFPRIGPAAALGAGGVAYFLVLMLLDVPPYHWYYVPPMTSLAMFLVIAIGVWLKEARGSPRLRSVVPRTVLVVTALLGVAGLVREVTQGVPWRTPIISTNFAPAAEYARIGVELRERIGTAPVAFHGEIGTIAYFCRCTLLEQFSDRGLLMPLIDQRIDGAGPLTRPLWRLNYLWLDRDQKPRPHRYTLRHAFGPGSGPNVWQYSSPWSGPSHMTLTRAP